MRQVESSENCGFMRRRAEQQPKWSGRGSMAVISWIRQNPYVGERANTPKAVASSLSLFIALHVSLYVTVCKHLYPKGFARAKDQEMWT